MVTPTQILVHGRAAADQASETSRKTFEEGSFAGALPTVEIARPYASQILNDEGKGLPAALFMASVKSHLKSSALRGQSAASSSLVISKRSHTFV